MQRASRLQEVQNVWSQVIRYYTLREAKAAGIKRPSKVRLHKKIFAPKGATLGTVDVHKGMSLEEFAKKVRIPGSRVLEATSQVCPDVFKGKSKELKKTLPDMSLFHKVATLLGYQVRFTKNEEEKIIDKDEYPRPVSAASQLLPRAPVITIMGHVDHGKTTLLDALRQSRVVDSEFGGITQHIGAFSVALSSLPDAPRITFLDTPGHAAFSAMRERGANCTDIVVLVVAADDGIMPQTEESIRFASAAGVPIIIAINKIDSPKADVENTLNEMVMKTPLLPESHGGEVQCVPISALKRKNLDLLQEAVIVQAELMDLRAEMDGPTEAIVLEAHSEKGRGKIATCLIRRGCLKKGATLVAGTAVCRVRAIFDEMGKRVNAARPSDPVEVSGWRELPDAGDLVLEVKNEARANEVQRYRESILQKNKQQKDFMAYQESMSGYKERYDEWRNKLMQLGYNSQARRALGAFYPSRDIPTQGKVLPRLNIVIKGDVQGSVEAIVQTLGQIQNSHLFELSIVSSGVGEVAESDIELAEAFDAIVYAFNLPIGPKVRELADGAGISIREFNVIYHLANDVRDEIISIIPDERCLELLGTANVLQIFYVTKEGSRAKVPVAGCFCDTGLLQYNATFRILRHNDQLSKPPAPKEEDEEDDETEEDEEASQYTVIFEGPCSSMFHKKEKMASIKKNSECGLQFVNSDGEPLNLLTGDRIECYEEVQRQQNADIEFDFDP